MPDTLDFFLSTKPAYPWSLSGIGTPMFVLFAALLVVLTVWSYSGNPLANRRRLFIIVTLRLLALFVALLTALRPSIGVQEEPKIPSSLIIGIDLSESMTVKDEFGDQSRIDAVRKMLTRCEPLLDELRTEQNVNVVFYGFGSPEFTEATGVYDPQAPAAFKRSDYGSYLARTLDRWQSERFVRGHLILGDGADNGTATSPITEASKWRRTAPIHTFGAGSKDTPSSARDVAFSDAIADPNPVSAKTDFKLRLRTQAFGFAGASVPIRVQFDMGAGYKDVLIERVRLPKDRDNIVELNLKAPELPEGKKALEVKIRAEIALADVPGDVNPSNNVIESYLTVTKDGLRILVVDRYRYEYAFLLDALASDPRIDVRKVDLQTDDGGASVRQAFDFDEQAYDVLILGNITANQIRAVDPTLPQKIAERVLKKGMGFMMIGGHATFAGSTDQNNASGWRGTTAIEDILPVDINQKPANVPDAVFTGKDKRYQFVVNPAEANHYLLKLGNTQQESDELWAKLNDDRRGAQPPRSRFTGLNMIGTAKPGATTLAYASDANALVKGGPNQGLPSLLVVHQIGDGNRGRVAAFAAQDTYLWQRLGQPKSSEGKQIHHRFWRQLVLWLAHQELDDDAAFARPEFPRVPVGRKQRIRVGLKGKNGATVIDPKFELKVIAPGETAATAAVRPVTVDENGAPIVTYDSSIPGEHLVKLEASGTTAAGEMVKAEASAKFLAYAEATDEMLRTAADYDLLQKVASSGGGTFHRLDDLPTFLKELKGQPLETLKPKPRYYPDWRRNYSRGFLPTWLVLFALLLGGEWALRRVWGLR